MEVARREDIEIPSLCSHSDVCVRGSCRVCVVEVKGCKDYLPACATEVYDGMEVITHNPEIQKIRKTNLELLFSQHKEECDDCVWNPGCKLLYLARRYFVEINKFDDRKEEYPELSFGGIVDFDSSKCIDCRNCLEVCPVSFLEMEGRGHLFEVTPSKEKACVYCGQCINHCPAGSFEADGEFEGVFKPFEGGEDKEIVFQIAPAARVSISEEFGLDPGTVSTGKLISGLRKVGADKVFDVSFGADFTTHEEAKEFLEQTEDDLPVMTSCCPSWVRFVECFYPDFIDKITNVRSPHIILGAVIKELSQNPDNVTVVSVMPCVSKKYEITRDELKTRHGRPVDHVLTVREVGRLFRDKNIDFLSLDEGEFDNPFGAASGNSISYGASGGVMEAALRHAYYLKTGNELMDENIKNREEFSFEMNGRKIRTKKINGLSEAVHLFEKLQENPNLYDYIEFMSCEGGCIGGGGQPVPTNERIRRSRRRGLIEEAKSKKVQPTHANKEFKKIYNKIKDKKELFYTTYTKKSPIEKIDTN